MRYLVIGAGGTGGTLGAYLAHAGKDITFIARGRTKAAMRQNGLRLKRPEDSFLIQPAKVFDMDEYQHGHQDSPDVIFVCVKGYSLDDTIPFIQRVAGPQTIVIPILNIYGTGGRMQEKLPKVLVTDGCIYVAAQIKEPGVIQMNGAILRVVFGVRTPEDYRPELEQIRDELNESGAVGLLSDNIQRDALLKFSYVSAQGACGLYHHCAAGEIQKPGPARESFKELVHEIDELAHAMGIQFQEDIVQRNLDILAGLNADATTSMQRDIYAGKQSEIDGLIYQVVRLADQYGLELPEYRKVAARMNYPKGVLPYG